MAEGQENKHNRNSDPYSLDELINVTLPSLATYLGISGYGQFLTGYDFTGEYFSEDAYDKQWSDKDDDYTSAYEQGMLDIGNTYQSGLDRLNLQRDGVNRSMEVTRRSGGLSLKNLNTSVGDTLSKSGFAESGAIKRTGADERTNLMENINNTLSDLRNNISGIDLAETDLTNQRSSSLTNLNIQRDLAGINKNQSIWDMRRNWEESLYNQALNIYQMKNK